jgi:DNA polymerase-3 subunit gamma/tau
LPEQALYLKWRPALFDQMVGQEHITRTLRNALKSGRIRHAYLFSGPRGTGKTTTARLLAKAVNCQHPDPDARPCNACAACIAVNEGRYLDLIEIDAATHTGVDDVRDLREKIAFSPGEGRYKVYIIDEVHRFSGSAFDALLKTLEEPPDHAIFVLATTEIDKVPPTIKSRCLQFEFRRLSVAEVADRLQLIVDAEGIQAERAALELIAREGTGSLRDSISLLDQIITDNEEVLTLSLVERILGTAGSAAVRALIEALVEGDAARGLRVIHEALDSGVDPRQFGAQIVESLRQMLLAQMGGSRLLEISQEERSWVNQQAGRIARPALMRAVRAFNEAVNASRTGWLPQLGLELALLESLSAEQAEADQPAFAVTQSLIDQIAARVLKSLPESAQRSAGAPSHEPASAALEPAPPPGTPGVVSLEAVRDRWDEMLTRLGQLNKSAPAAIRAYFRPQRVEGNMVYLATDSALYFDRMQDERRRRIVEQAMSEVHQTTLRIRIVMGNAISAPAVHDDPLLAGFAEAGAKIQEIQPKE